jgi:hypothetical protein
VCLAPPVLGQELQAKRLCQRLHQVGREVDHQKQQLLLEALEAVMPVGADQILQARPVPLARPPGETAYRLAPEHLNLSKVPYRAGDRRPAQAPGGSPAVTPTRAEVQGLPVGLVSLVQTRKVAQAAGVGPQTGPLNSPHCTGPAR